MPRRPDYGPNDAEWFIDIGLELWESTYAYQWITNLHTRIVSEVMPVEVTDLEVI